MIGLAVGRLLDVSGQDNPQRALWIDPGRDLVVVIDIVAPNALPIHRSLREIFEQLAASECRFLDIDPWADMGGDESVLSETHRAHRDKCWSLIKPIVFDQPAVFSDAGRAAAIKRVIAETGSNKMTLYRLLRRYWQRGATPNALLPDYFGSVSGDCWRPAPPHM